MWDFRLELLHQRLEGLRGRGWSVDRGLSKAFALAVFTQAPDGLSRWVCGDEVAHVLHGLDGLEFDYLMRAGVA